MPAEESLFLKDVVETITDASGRRPKGWMGPGLTETFETPRILRDLGLTYVLDWCADDQPFPLNVPGMISVPYAIELNDIALFVSKSLSGDDFYRTIVDQFDQLYEDSAKSGRVMALALHPFVIGQPCPHKYLAKVQTARSAPTQKRSRKSRFSTLPEPFFGRSMSENSMWRGTL
jgi:allantoinase